MKNGCTKAAVRCRMQRTAKRLLWGLFFLIKGLTGTAILILAVLCTGICYLLVWPFVVAYSAITSPQTNERWKSSY